MSILKTWTLTAPGGSPLMSHFAEGLLNNVTDTAVLDQLQLPVVASPIGLPFINIPVSTGSTVRRARSDTGAEVASYRAMPTGQKGNPSRTAVDRFGNCWVGLRDAGDFGDPVTTASGAAVKYGLVVGGTRVDADGTVNPTGDYLAPPYTYNTIRPHSGNATGFIRTSRGFSDTRAWTGLTADAAIDDAIQLYVRAGSRITRFVNMDANDNVWIAGNDFSGFMPQVARFDLLDGLTGSVIDSHTNTGTGFGGHGGIVHSSGLLFSTDVAADNGGANLGVFVRFDPSIAGPTAFSHVDVVHAHNCCEDPAGNIWVIAEGGFPALYKFDTNLTLASGFPKSPGAVTQGRGICCTFADSSIWIIESVTPGLIHRCDLNGVLIETISPATTGDPRGCAVDAAGKVWFSAFANNFMRRLAPGSPSAVDLSIATGQSSYAYADFCGISGIQTVNPSGVWTVVFDAGSTKNFSRISWTELVPASTSVNVRYRIANTQIGLVSQPWIVPINGQAFGRTSGRFVEVQVFFARDNPGVVATPVLYDLTIEDNQVPQIVVYTECAAQVQTSAGRGLVGVGGGAGMGVAL